MPATPFLLSLGSLDLRKQCPRTGRTSLSAWLRPSMGFTSVGCSDGVGMEKEEREETARRTKGHLFLGL